jgi:hypothetical protein
MASNKDCEPIKQSQMTLPSAQPNLDEREQEAKEEPKDPLLARIAALEIKYAILSERIALVEESLDPDEGDEEEGDEDRVAVCMLSTGEVITSR